MDTDRGYKRLQEFFGEVPREYSEGLILEFGYKLLGKLTGGLDVGGVVEFYRNDPVRVCDITNIICSKNNIIYAADKFLGD